MRGRMGRGVRGIYMVLESVVLSAAPKLPSPRAVMILGGIHLASLSFV